MDAIGVITKLNLIPLPNEGGFYRQTYQSEEMINVRGGRHLASAIYYLVTPEEFSLLHRLSQDETFHFYLGDPVSMIQISENGSLIEFTLGNHIEAGEVPQVVVPKRTWQGTKLRNGGKWSLLGTTVSPGFEFEDMEMGDRYRLMEEFPEHRTKILEFTRQ